MFWKFFLFFVFVVTGFIPWQRMEAAPITVAVVAKDADTYHQALSALKGADANIALSGHNFP